VYLFQDHAAGTPHLFAQVRPTFRLLLTNNDRRTPKLDKLVRSAALRFQLVLLTFKPKPWRRIFISY
jgi:hypothetical protein